MTKIITSCICKRSYTSRDFSNIAIPLVSFYWWWNIYSIIERISISYKHVFVIILYFACLHVYCMLWLFLYHFYLSIAPHLSLIVFLFHVYSFFLELPYEVWIPQNLKLETRFNFSLVNSQFILTEKKNCDNTER